VQKVDDLNRDLATRWAELVMSLSGVVREHAEKVSHIVQDQTESVADLAREQVEKTEQAARQQAENIEQAGKDRARWAPGRPSVRRPSRPGSGPGSAMRV
jgi:hypothetical protein